MLFLEYCYLFRRCLFMRARSLSIFLYNLYTSDISRNQLPALLTQISTIDADGITH